MRTLYAWIGTADLNAPGGGGVSLGPIANVVDVDHPDRIVLLNSWLGSSGRSVQEYVGWLRQRTEASVECIEAPLKSPIDYREIYEVAKEILSRTRPDDEQATYHLSPGTPAMAAVWIVLAKSVFPARLIQSSKERGVEEVDLPFELSAEYVPLSRLRDTAAASVPLGAEFRAIIHKSDRMRTVLDRAQKVAPYDIPVLIEGPSGSGKELLANAIHNAGRRAKGPFVSVNCGAIPADLAESEFFGHERGAFTGAVRSKIGLLEAAHGGTLFLDEIGELGRQNQVKLLRVIEEQKITRLGSTKPKDISIRVIAATNRNLVAEVSRGAFREDLFYRIATFVLRLPPIQEREGDLSLLIDAKLGEINETLFGDAKAKTLVPAARRLYLVHSWPGNVRELTNTLFRAALWSRDSKITEDEARDALLSVGEPEADLLHLPLRAGFDLEAVLWAVRQCYLQRALKMASGNRARAGKLLGVSGQTVTDWLNRFNLDEETA